jgi:hypothetical protein
MPKAEWQKAELPADRESERAELHAEERVVELPTRAKYHAKSRASTYAYLALMLYIRVLSKCDNTSSYPPRVGDPSPLASYRRCRHSRQPCIHHPTAEEQRCFRKHGEDIAYHHAAR